MCSIFEYFNFLLNTTSKSGKLRLEIVIQNQSVDTNIFRRSHKTGPKINDLVNKNRLSIFHGLCVFHSISYFLIRG